MLFGLLALLMGGAMWLLALPFLLGLRRLRLVPAQPGAARPGPARTGRPAARRAARRPAGYDATEELGRFAEPLSTGSVVRIDDDDLDLHSMDTIDLTGLYSEDPELEPMRQRRAS